MMLYCLLMILNAGLAIDADAPCDLVQIRDVLQIGSNYFILDKGDHQVKVTDDGGELLYHFGQKGEGPGEFQYPSALGAVNGEIWVHDLIQSQVQRFSLKGKYLGMHKIAAVGPLQFEPEHLVLHTPTQAHMFTVLNNEFKELGQFGKGMDAIGGVNVDEIVNYLQVFTIDSEQNKLYSIGVNGKLFCSYDLKTMARQHMRELPLENYAATQKVQQADGGVRIQGGRPIQDTVFHNGYLYTLIADETKEDHTRLVVLDTRGKLLQNTKLDTHFTHMIGNTKHSSAFFINVDESLIEEHALVPPPKPGK